MELGQKIGVGAQADVFLSDHTAVKLFKSGFPKAYVFYEAAVTTMIEETGLPIAKVHEVFEVEDQLAIRIDYINGISLNDCAKDDMGNLMHYIGILVDLQLMVHSKPIYLPFQLHDRLKGKIENNENIDSLLKSKLLKKLDTLPRGWQLCHGDFHGGNIIKQGDEYFIIDWIDATVGHPDADATRTYMLYAFGNQEVADLYLDCYCKKTNKDKSDVLEWLPIVAAARLSEGFSGNTEKIMGWVNGI